jgi:hypothetical protein
LEGFIHFVLDKLSVHVGSYLCLALFRDTESHILEGSSEAIYDLHGEIDVLIAMESAVVIISKVVEEFA